MKFKNFTIITLIFVVPLVMYTILSKPDASFANKAATGGNKPQIIKFTSLMCLDCKKLSSAMKEVYPKYSDKITLVEVQVQNNDDFTKKQVEKYNVTLVPTLILIDSKGKKVSKTEGFIEKEQLDKMMRELN
ncbi:MAG: thioredoxin family protein [Candidatus Gastranaerophilales bacterium]|nr:thioredoxin family protein [Candidatus Gastranaerophilales bacterium]